MIDLRKRSYEKEKMDADNIPFADIARTLNELNIINTRLGGHAITLEGVRRLIAGRKSVLVCEIGCGGGDNLFAVHAACIKRDIDARFIGIDMNPDCIQYARKQYPDLPCEWICSDYAITDLTEQKPDIIFSSLFCHHFTDEQLINMLHWLKENSRLGFFINDLHRHWLAYYLIKYITRWFSRSYLVKNDACLSVARSFRKKDWKDLFASAGIAPDDIRWKWAFRWLVTARNNKIADSHASISN
jgi:2-polyprenyl-3-methyl-5-hydroxy-6-metoxy-1,4-benzoquinol methylase